MSETASNGTNEHYKPSTDFESVKESFEKVREAPSASVKLGAFLDTANEFLDMTGRWKDNFSDWSEGFVGEARWQKFENLKRKVEDSKVGCQAHKAKDVHERFARLPKVLDSVWCASLPGKQGELGNAIIDRGLGIANLSKDDFDKDFDKLDEKVRKAIPNDFLRKCVYEIVNGKKPSDLLTVSGVLKYVGKSLVNPESALYSTIAALIPGYAQCVSAFRLGQKLFNFVKSVFLDPRRIIKEFKEFNKEAEQRNLRIEQLKYATGESVSRPSEIGSVDSKGAIADMCAILRSGGFNAAHREGFREYLREQKYGRQGDFISGDLNSKDPDSLKAYKIAMGLAAAGLGVGAIKSIMKSGEAESLPDMASDTARTARSAAGAAARGAQAAAGAASKSIGDIKKQLQSISDSFQPDMLSLYQQTDMLKNQVQSLRRLTQGGDEVEIQRIAALYDHAATLIKDDIASKYIRKVQNSLKEYIDKV